jgi:hypothetical protein
MNNLLKIILHTALFTGLFIFAACKAPNNEKKKVQEADTTLTPEETIKEVKKIFYRVYLPSEMYKIFDKVGALYTPEILNPAENVNLYESSYKEALNFGVYGVDLGYNKIFGQNQKSLLYFTVIHKLSQQLGIPDIMFSKAILNMENNLSNKDSIVKYATEIYVATQDYLKENERGSTAALILAGGWIEAMYVASCIADDLNDNREIVERIAFQKYSLRSLLAVLANYKSDPEINKLYLMFKALNDVYDKFEIYYSPDDISIDTINKYIKAKKIEFYIPPEDFKELKKKIAQIRHYVVS